MGQKQDKQSVMLEDGQMKMPIKQPRSELVYGLKRNLDRSITYAGVVPYWRNFLFVAAFLTTFFTILTLGYVLLLYYFKLPLQIPIFFSQATNSWTAIDRKLIIGIPASMIFYLVAITYLNAKIFRFDRRLVEVINLSIIIADLLLLLGLGQILSLLLVY